MGGLATALIPILLSRVLPRKNTQRGVIFIGKIGRPLKSSEPKTVSLHLRITQKESERIQKCSEETGKTRTDVIMQGIDLLEKEIEKQKK